MKRISLHIKGKVQGVWYRKSTKEKADSLDLSGFVQNEDDGSVYAEVEGDDTKIQHFITWCKEGPEYAQVKEVLIADMKLRSIKGFEIRR